MLSTSTIARVALLALALSVLFPGPAAALAPEEEAQGHVRQAMLALEQDNVDTALKLFDKAADAAALIADAPWRDAVLDDANDAIIAVLAAAGAAKWDQGAYDASYKLYARAVSRGGLGPLGDEIRGSAARAVTLHMLQVWLSGDEKAARSLASIAKDAADGAFPQTSPEHRAMAGLASRIARPRSLETLVRSEIERTKRGMENDAPRHPDPRQTYQVALLARTLRAFDLAQTLFEKALTMTDEAKPGDRAIVIGSREKLDHIKSLTRRLTIRSNVPFYSVEVWRPDAQLPEGAEEVTDATAGVSFSVYPGRYVVKVFNAEYGTCERDDVLVETADTVARCRFDAPPVNVTLESEPKGLEARVMPSDMIEWRALPFSLNLMRGRYVMAVKHPAFRDPVEVPFVVTRDGQQTIALDLSRGTVEVQLGPGNQAARLRVDGREVPRTLGRQVDLEPGVHTVEVFQPGFETFRQQVVVRPQGRTQVAATLVAGVGEDEEPPPPALTATSEVGYRAQLRDMELEGYDRSGTLNTVRRTYAIHRTHADLRWFVAPGDDPYDPRWFVRGAADVGFASANPVDDMLLVDAEVGAGVQLLSRGGEWVVVHGAWHLGWGEWSSTWSEGAFTMTQLRPIGLSLSALARLGWLEVSFATTFDMGTGLKRQNATIPGLPTGDVDLDIIVFDAALFAGVDIVDLIVPDEDLDVMLGPTGYFTWYREKRSDKPSAFQVATGGAGLRLAAAYTIRGAVDTRIGADVEARFFGDLATELPAVFDEKRNVGAVSGIGNLSVGVGVQLGF